MTNDANRSDNREPTKPAANPFAVPPDAQSEAKLQPLSCDSSIEELYGYLDGALDQSRAQSIQSHLETCAGCDDVFAFHHQLHSLVSQMGRAEMPNELPNRVFGSILGESPLGSGSLGPSEGAQSGPLGSGLGGMSPDISGEANDRPFEI